MGITDVKGHFIHVAARQSPYPGTSIARFPVFDKYVPWEVSYTEPSCGSLFTDVMGVTDVKGHFIHVAARQSLYPGTSIAHFPVFDKYVPWAVSYTEIICL